MLQYRPGLRAARGGARPLSHTNTLGRGLGGQRAHRENPRDTLALLTSSLLCLVGVVVTGYYFIDSSNMYILHSHMDGHGSIWALSDCFRAGNV
jgi:hypothetical protein